MRCADGVRGVWMRLSSDSHERCRDGHIRRPTRARTPPAARGVTDIRGCMHDVGACTPRHPVTGERATPRLAHTGCRLPNAPCSSRGDSQNAKAAHGAEKAACRASCWRRDGAGAHPLHARRDPYVVRIRAWSVQGGVEGTGVGLVGQASSESSLHDVHDVARDAHDGVPLEHPERILHVPRLHRDA